MGVSATKLNIQTDLAISNTEVINNTNLNQPTNNQIDTPISNNQSLTDTYNSRNGIERKLVFAQVPNPMPSRTNIERMERERLENLPRVVSDNGGIKITNMPRNYQHNTIWNDDAYRGGQDGLLGDLGCTYSAIGIGLSIYGVPINTRDVNNVSHNVRVAVDNVSIRDLSGNGGKIEIGRTLANWNERVRISQINPPIDLGTDKANEILNQAREAVRQGKPVLLGFRGNGTDRHSVTVIGVNQKGELLVLDPWKESSPGSNQARYIPLNQVIKELNYTQIDYAYEFSRKR